MSAGGEPPEVFIHPSRRALVVVPPESARVTVVDLYLDGRRIQGRLASNPGTATGRSVFVLEDPTITRLVRQRREIGVTVAIGAGLHQVRMATDAGPDSATPRSRAAVGHGRSQQAAATSREPWITPVVSRIRASDREPPRRLSDRRVSR